MRRVLAALAALFLPMGLIVAAAVTWTVLALRADAQKMANGWTPAPAVLWWARFWDQFYGIPWSLHLAVLHNEGSSTPRPPTSAELAALQELGQTPASVYPMGDLGISRGPSLGAGDVLRSNVLRLWDDVPFYLRPLVTAPTPYHLALPGYERQAMWASAKILREALDDAGGDLHDAARRYNGEGDKAEAYATRADNARAALVA